MASNTKGSEALASTGSADANRLGALGRAYSVSIVGAVAKAFAPGDFLGTRTAKRFFAGDTTTDGHRTNVFEDVAAVLVDAGVVTTSDLLHHEDVSRALEEAALRWTETVATLQSRAGTLGEGVAERALRFAVVDLSVRAFAVLRLGKRPVPKLGTPLWAQPNGGGLSLPVCPGIERERPAIGWQGRGRGTPKSRAVQSPLTLRVF